MKNAILIETENGLFAMPVQNFSKENVIKGICKMTGFEKSNIEQLSASMSYGIYGLKKLVSDNGLIEIKDYRCDEYPFNFEVKYINII